MPEVQVTYNADGSLGSEPVLLNPPTDPDLRTLASTTLQAVKRCNPLKIPEQYAAAFEQWREGVKNLQFDPEDMAQ